MGDHERGGHSSDRFTGRVADYDRWRPDYPAQAIDASLELPDGAPDPGRELVVVDVGAGTGIAARLFAARGCRVLAVEPNDEMRDAGQAHPSERIAWLPATAERTTLPDACADLIVCAQAFHWLDRAAALDEFARVLNPSSPLGRVALLWNIARDDHAAANAYRRTMQRHARDAPCSPWAVNTPVGIDDDPRFADYRLLTFDHDQSLSFEGLVGRSVSASYAPADGPDRAELEADLRELFDEHADHERGFPLAYRTEAHLAELANPAHAD